MSIEKMEFLSAAGLLKDLDRTLEKCVECKCFHIGDAVRESAGSESELSRLDEDNPYKELLKRIHPIAITAHKSRFEQINLIVKNKGLLRNIIQLCQLTCI